MKSYYEQERTDRINAGLPVSLQPSGAASSEHEWPDVIGSGGQSPSEASSEPQEWTYIPCQVNPGRADCGDIKQGETTIVYAILKHDGEKIVAAHNAELVAERNEKEKWLNELREEREILDSEREKQKGNSK